MTSTQRFIEDAIKGGWGHRDTMPPIYFDRRIAFFGEGGCSEKETLLDPLAWQAVGKTRGWRERSEGTFEAEHTCWQAYWTGFYQHLADGKTIEAALSDIEGKV